METKTSLKIIPCHLVYSLETGTTYLKIEGKPLTREEFNLLRRNDLIFGMFREYAWDNEIPQGWYLDKDIRRLEQLGFTVPTDVKRELLEEQERIKKLNNAEKVARKAADELTCPKCGKNLALAVWKPHAATLTCYDCRYDAVIAIRGESYKLVKAGFFDEMQKETGVFWYYKVMEEVKK